MILDSHVGYAPRTIVQIMRWLIRMIRYAERTLHGLIVNSLISIERGMAGAGN